MRQPNKGLLLFVLFAVPLGIFAFLYFTGKNHYRITKYYPLDSTQVNGKWQVRYHTIPPFEFTDQSGKPFNSQELKGKIYIVDFFFTHCGNPTLCPTMSQQMKRVQDYFVGNEQIKLVSFTVDPTRDTPEVLRQYGQRYGADFRQWTFLTGDKKAIYSLAYHGFKINAGEEGTAVTPEFMHATKFILIDGQGRVRGYYDGITREDVDRLLTEVKILLTEK